MQNGGHNVCIFMYTVYHYMGVEPKIGEKPRPQPFGNHVITVQKSAQVTLHEDVIG